MVSRTVMAHWGVPEYSGRCWQMESSSVSTPSFTAMPMRALVMLLVTLHARCRFVSSKPRAYFS